jgi:hypothetical protein
MTSAEVSSSAGLPDDFMDEAYRAEIMLLARARGYKLSYHRDSDSRPCPSLSTRYEGRTYFASKFATMAAQAAALRRAALDSFSAT